MNEDKLIRLKELEAIIGFKKGKIYKLQKEKNSTFPKKINVGSRISLWSLVEINSWIKAKRDMKIN